MSEVVAVHALTKTFGDVAAVDDVSSPWSAITATLTHLGLRRLTI